MSTHHLAGLWERQSRRLLLDSAGYPPGHPIGERLVGRAQALQACAEQLVARIETERIARDRTTEPMP